MNAAPLHAFASSLRKLHSEPDDYPLKPTVNEETHLCRKGLHVLHLQAEAATPSTRLHCVSERQLKNYRLLNHR